MISHILGLALILISCGGMGQLFSRRLQNHYLLLGGLIQGLLLLEREISYGANLLPKALQTAAQGCGYGEAWQRALGELREIYSLSEEEYQLLLAFGQGLGISHKEDQIKRLELCRLNLQDKQDMAAIKWQQMGKVWKNLGWAGGLTLILLFM
ncbi:MAG: stage III sporulation protein AB [Clostridiales bacterium]